MVSLSKSGSEDKDPLPISALQHWLFCPRQCCLIHVERLWEENRFTAEGRLLHERADTGGNENRGGKRILRNLPIRSKALDVAGVADVVELRDGKPLPVEYKRGKPKAHRADEVQLCAQAICLEEMFGCTVPEGHLFYGQPRRRSVIPLDDDLRTLTANVAKSARAAISAGQVPPPAYEKRKCGACSLAQLCKPRQLEQRRKVSDWLQRRIEVS